MTNEPPTHYLIRSQDGIWKDETRKIISFNYWNTKLTPGIE